MFAAARLRVLGRARSRYALALGCAAVSPLARATDAAPRLEWSAPAECPSEAQVEASLSALLAREALHWERFDAVRGRVARAGPEWQLDLEFVAGAELRRRTLQARECRDLADAAAVAIVLALNSYELDASGVVPAAARALDAAPEVEAHSSDPGEPLGVDIGAGALLDPSTLGAAAFGAEAALRGRIGRFSAALYALVLPAVRTELGGGQGIDIGLWAGGLRGCWQLRPSVAACASGEVGRVAASGAGLRAAASGDDVWLAPGLSVALSAPLFDGVWLSSNVVGLLPLVRSQFRVDESEVVHQLPVVAVRLGVGLEFALR